MDYKPILRTLSILLSLETWNIITTSIRVGKGARFNLRLSHITDIEMMTATNLILREIS